MFRRSDTRGFTLIEMIMAIVLIALIGTVSIDTVGPSRDVQRFDQTRANIDAIKKAVLGDPSLITGGHRTSFGYVGDWGGLPTGGLANLTTAQAPAYSFSSTYHVGAGWNGPYLSTGFGNVSNDAWGRAFVVSAGPPASITSLGADGAAGGTGVNQDITAEFPTTSYLSTVSGRVLNGNNALSAQTVEIRYPVAGVLTAFTTATDANGNFAFNNVPFGNRVLTVTSPNVLGPKVITVDAPHVQVPGDFLNFYSSGVPTANMDAVCCRLSLSNTLAVTTTDITTGATLYLQPYLGGTITVYDGAQWVAQTISAAVSIARPTVANKNYDVFVYANGGAVALELIAWNTDTARLTALGTQDGVLVKGTDATHRYFGTIRMNASTRLEDSGLHRFVFNYYNRVPRELRRVDATATWTSLAGWRAGNGSAANRVEIVIGQPISYLSLTLAARGSNSKNAAFYTGIAEDATNRNDAEIQGYSTSNLLVPLEALLHRYPSVGYHFYSWTENGGSANTSYAGNSDSGLFGIIDM